MTEMIAAVIENATDLTIKCGYTYRDLAVNDAIRTLEITRFGRLDAQTRRTLYEAVMRSEW